MNALNKIIEIIAVVVLLFLCPIQYFAEKQQIIIGQKVMAETSYFTDTIRNTGKLTKEMYEQFISQLSLTQNIYEVEILHYHTVYYEMGREEETDDTGEEFHYVESPTEEVQEDLIFRKSYYLYTTKDITKALYGDEKLYTFSQGDYIRICLKQKNRSLLERIQSSLSLIPIEDNNRVIYGGLIRNETY